MSLLPGHITAINFHVAIEVDDSEFQPPEAELDEYHHKATRTLFVGNLELDIDKQQLRSIFQKYGFIVVSVYLSFL